MEQGRTGKDCVIVALANYCHKSYDGVVKDCYDNVSSDIFSENHWQHGFRPATYLKVFELYLNRKAIHIQPKGKQWLFTGLVRVSRSGRKTGHLVFCLLGIVYDVDGKEMRLDDYRKRYGYNVNDVWM